jgi:uroporphyrinogen-III synthase
VTAPRLDGRTVLVTRALEDADRWARRLSELGATPVVLPCLVIEPIEDRDTAARLERAVADSDWLVASSRRGVEIAARLLTGGLPSGIRIAAVGPATGKAAALAWGRCDLIAAEPTALGLGRELAEVILRGPPDAVRQVLLIEAATGRREIEPILAAYGIQTVAVAVYRTVAAPTISPRRDLRSLGVDHILLASPSAVAGLVNQATVPDEVRVVTIGPTTTRAARAAGLTVAAQARRPDLDGMVEVMG